MALMKFREPNQVKWQGVRPAHNGTQVLETDVVVSGTKILYTVAAGKILYLTHAYLGVGLITAIGIGYLWIRDSTPTNLYLLGVVRSITDTPSGPSFPCYWPPIEIPATYDIAVIATANLEIHATIHGWVE